MLCEKRCLKCGYMYMYSSEVSSCLTTGQSWLWPARTRGAGGGGQWVRRKGWFYLQPLPTPELCLHQSRRGLKTLRGAPHTLGVTVSQHLQIRGPPRCTKTSSGLPLILHGRLHKYSIKYQSVMIIEIQCTINVMSLTRP